MLGYVKYLSGCVSPLHTYNCNVCENVFLSHDFVNETYFKCTRQVCYLKKLCNAFLVRGEKSVLEKQNYLLLSELCL